MFRKLGEEKLIVTFEEITDFDTLLHTPTIDIIYDNDGYGVCVSILKTSVKKKKSWIHGHRYIVPQDERGNKITRDTFPNSDYKFYRVNRTIEYKGKKYGEFEYFARLLNGALR